MRMKHYVFSHPVNAFIILRLGISVEVFCELYGFKQGTLSSWITRDKEVATLPISFLHALSLAAGESMDGVYELLCEYEEEYKAYLKSSSPKKLKKHLDKD